MYDPVWIEPFWQPLNFVITGNTMHKLLILLVILITAMSAFAQSQSTTGNIEGRVADPNGAVVPGVSVTAKNQDTGFRVTVIYF